jgi:hypothetical protein
MLRAVLNGWGTWCVILREEHTLRVLQDMLLRIIIGPKRDEVAGGCRKLHNEELHNLYTSPSIIIVTKPRTISWAEHIALVGEAKIVYKILIGIPEWKRPL